MEDGGARSPLPGQRGECRRGGIFWSIDQFWDTNTSDLLYGLQNIVCVLQVDALQSQKNRDTHYRTPKSALLPGYQVNKFASLQAPPWVLPLLSMTHTVEANDQEPDRPPLLNAHFLRDLVSGGKLTNTVATHNYIQCP